MSAEPSAALTSFSVKGKSAKAEIDQRALGCTRSPSAVSTVGPRPPKAVVPATPAESQNEGRCCAGDPGSSGRGPSRSSDAEDRGATVMDAGFADGGRAARGFAGGVGKAGSLGVLGAAAVAALDSAWFASFGWLGGVG